ncbi:MAG: mobile mystery protein B [Phycisphaerae bacterium]
MSPFESLPGETPIEVSGLRVKGILTRQQLNAVEAANIRSAAQKYLAAKPSQRSAPFHLQWACKLHKEMFGKVWSWAGQPRTTDLNIGLPAPHVQSALHSLMEDLAFWKTANLPLLEQAAILHHRAVFIHPFLNGNGRWSRLLANIWLKRHDHPITEWPEQTLGNESIIRKEYLLAIQAADQGDYQPLIQVVTRYTPSPPS